MPNATLKFFLMWGECKKVRGRKEVGLFFFFAVAIVSACFDSNSAAIFSLSHDVLFILKKKPQKITVCLVKVEMISRHPFHNINHSVIHS